MLKRRIRRIGESMPLPESYPKGVFFIGRRSVDGTERIAGTGFLVTMQSPILWHSYVVTAGHVVEGADSTFVRIRTAGDGTRDIPVPDWVPHGKHDIAVAPILLPEDHDVASTGLDQFIDEPGMFGNYFWGDIELGDVIYFIGLLGKVPEMVKRNVPIVRAGVLGAMWQEQVPIKRTPVDETRFITAHLIDCRSFGGFSGSPCYLQKSRPVYAKGDTPGITQEYRTALLGLIGGHFDDWAKARTRQSIGADPDSHEYGISDDVLAPVSTGVGYVIPAEFIRETLMREELVEMRDKDEKEAQRLIRKLEDENAATPDSIEDESELERFEDLTRRLVNTPKPKAEKQKDGS